MKNRYRERLESELEDNIIIDSSKSKKVIAQAPLQDLGVENRNRRTYSTNVIAKMELHTQDTVVQ